MPKIFVSYRREDSDVIAGRIRDWLARSFGDKSVFMDIDNIPVGVDFREHVKGVLLQNDVLVAVIGPQWLGRGEEGRTRIQEETDPVRVEIEAALQRGTPVVPVLVHGASMPNPADLPTSLRSLAFQNAATIDSGRDFQHHMDRLIRSMNSLVKVSAARTQRPWLWALSGAAAMAAVLLPSFWVYLHTMAPAPVVVAQPVPQPTPTPAPQPAPTAPAPTPSEPPMATAARTMLERVVTDLKADRASTIAKIGKYEGDYYYDQYVFCFTMADGRYVVHPVKSLIGSDIRLIKDADGLPVGQMVYDAAKEGTIAAIPFRFSRAGGSLPVPFTSLITRIGDLACGVQFNR